MKSAEIKSLDLIHAMNVGKLARLKKETCIRSRNLKDK